jgi:hypothetical protein
MAVNSFGGKYWRLHGQLHCEDGPAIEYADGGKEWYLKGKRHRTYTRQNSPHRWSCC